MRTNNYINSTLKMNVKCSIFVLGVLLCLISSTFGQGISPSNSTLKHPLENSNPGNSNFLYTLLESFEVKSIERDAMIKWSTLFETNYHLYTIERTSDVNHWETMCEVHCAGNPSGEAMYSWVDGNPLLGTSYYRLKITDIDGNSEYSAIKAFCLNYEGNIELLAYPNPFTDYVIIEGSTYDLSNLSIINAAGLEVGSNAAIFWEDSNHLSVDVSTFRSGCYYIKTPINVFKISKL